MSITDKQRINDYFKEGYTPDGEKYLVNSFADESNLEELKELLTDQWNEGMSADSDKHQLDHILHKLNYQINSLEQQKSKPVIIRFATWYARIAALLLIPVLTYTGVITYQNRKSKGIEGWAEMNAPMGSRIKFILPDGSKGFLNSGSTIRYALNFSEKREVLLSGEAFFDVQHIDEHQFVVKTKYLDVEVKGTAFDVAAYAGEDQIDVTLERGSVLLTSKSFGLPIEMRPDEQVSYNTNKQVFKKSNVTASYFSAWKEGKLMLRNASLDELAKQLSRWYNIDVEIQNTCHADFQYRATFENENLNEVLRLLKISSALDYKITERVKLADGSFSNKK